MKNKLKIVSLRMQERAVWTVGLYNDLLYWIHSLYLFSVCPYGRYGEGCVSVCSVTCAYPVCDKITGVCEEGCRSGYTGDFCHEGNIYS